MSRPPKVAAVAGFMDFITAHVPAPWLGAELADDACDMEAAIKHGLVRLSTRADGDPVWCVTEAGAEYAAGWGRASTANLAP
jgi:hypothetical protein